MKEYVTSQEAILQKAKDLAYSQGIGQINMRNLAESCGASIGTIYKYFPTKNHLIMCIVADFWRDTSPIVQELTLEATCFTDYVQAIFELLSRHLELFKANLLGQISQLNSTHKQEGKAMEEEYMQHIQKGIMLVLAKDPAIPAHIWQGNFTQASLAAFVFSNLMQLLRNQQSNCSFLQEILRKVLYVSA